jgi:hypothetical protein
MVERICPRCQHGNPLVNRFCGQCGALLERTELETRRQAGIPIPVAPNLPAQLRHVGQAVAVSLAALAVEAGLAWVRRRVERMSQPMSQPVNQPVNQPVSQPSHTVPGTTPIVQSSRQPVGSPPTPSAKGTVTIWSQRLVEVWEQGTLSRQTIERHVWRREEE